MSTSLAEQLRRLAVPQTSILVDSKKRPSILFDPKEAATKNRKTIFDLGYEGLMKLVEINSSFLQFEQTLFDRDSINLERSVESAKVNELLDKVIKKFFCYLSPYFMLQPAHLCLEWLIRRFNIHEYNKTDFIGLILPYHETKIFVKCVQLFSFKNPNDQWIWLKPIQRPGVSLSKTAILNRAANDVAFLEFVCKTTKSTIKELDTQANMLQAQINFYNTVVIGGLEYAREVSEAHILAIVPSLLKGFSSKSIDFTAASLMITAQLCSKTKLKPKVLYSFIGKISSISYQPMQGVVILSLITIYRTQSDNLNDFPEKHLVPFITKKWIISTFATLSAESVLISPICDPLVGSCIRNVMAKTENWNECKTFLEALITQMQFKGEDVNNLIKTVLNNYQRSKKRFSESEVIEIESDTEDMVPEVDIQVWYSQYLQQLEKQYPIQFDNVIKHMMQENNISESRKQALKTVLSFHLKSSYFEDDTSIYENLYHHNSHRRKAGVRFLIENFNDLELSVNKKDLLSDSLKDRLNDDHQEVVAEVLKLSSEDLTKFFDNETLIENLAKILFKYQTVMEWKKPIVPALSHLTKKSVYEGTNLNKILLIIFPFLLPVSDDELKYTKIIFWSDFMQEFDFLIEFMENACELSTYRDVASKCVDSLVSSKDIPPVKNVLKLFENVMETEFEKSLNFSYFLLLIQVSYSHEVDTSVSYDVLKVIMSIKDKLPLVHIEGDDELLDFMRKNKICLCTFLKLLEMIVNSTEVENLNNFNVNSRSEEIYLEIFEFLTENAFQKSEKEGKSEYTEALKNILQISFNSSEEKLKFLANFFVYDRIPNAVARPELQIRSIRLFGFVATGEDQSYKIDEVIFVKILLALSSKIDVVRECALRVLETLMKVEGVDSKMKIIVAKILEHSEEIEMHVEHLALILSMIIAPGKKSKKEMSSEEKESAAFVLKMLLEIVNDSSTEIYLKSELLDALKHIQSTSVFKKVLNVGLEILNSHEITNPQDCCILEKSRGKILELIAYRYNEATIKLLVEEPQSWEFIEKCFKQHKILLQNSNDKIISIASLVLNIFDEQIYNEMPEKFKEKFLELVVNAVTLNDRDSTLASNAKKFVKHIELNGKHILPILEKMKDVYDCETTSNRGKIKNVAPDLQALNSLEWKNGITLLELLQNKTKLENYKILIPVLFGILKKCVDYEEQFTLEYVKQLTLSCLLVLCQKLLSLPANQRDLPESAFEIHLVVQCIRETQNSQTHHHALLLLSQCAKIIPLQVLHNMIGIFTFMGSTIVRHDNAFSFQIISNIIESVIPTLIQATGKQGQKSEEELVIPVLKVFADMILDIPEHRRLLLYTKLLHTIGASKYLWMFLCTVFESHVLQSEKKKKDIHSLGNKFLQASNASEFPKRLEIALQITKDFEPSISLETCSSLLVYVKSLPMDKIDDENNMEIDITESTLFNVDAHSSKQFRHYKYIILQFINTFIASTEFINQVAMFDDEQTKTMKVYYQCFIIKILSYIPDVIKAVEKTSDSNQSKFWKVILHHCYDILDNAISLLSPDMLLAVIFGLMQHQLPAVRKKVIDILINKLQYKADYFENCDEENMLKILDPLTEITDSILTHETLMENATSNEIVYIQQSALIAIKILSKLMATKHPELFKEILSKLMKIIKKRRNVPRILLATIALTMAEVSANLRAHSIAHLPKFMPLLIGLLEDQSKLLSTRPPDNVCIAIVTGIQKIFEVLPKFLGPYLADILICLIQIWIKCMKYQEDDSKTKTLIPKLTSIWTKFATVIPLRILVPNCKKAYSKLLEKNEYTGVQLLMKLLKESFIQSSGSDIQAMHAEISSLFLDALEFRSKFCDEVEVKEIEESIVQAFVALTLKLSESSFRPFYQKLFDWALRETTSKEKSITYFFLSSKVAEALQSLFVLFSSDFIQPAAELLDKCNSVKSNELYFPESSDRNTILINYILETLNHVFLHDIKGFINSYRFDILMQPIVDQLENPLVLSNTELQEILLSTLSQLAVSVSDDRLWKQLNIQVLLKTRNNSSDIRILSFKCCVEIARKLGEDFSPLLPQTIPFIAELLEDDVERVEKSCRTGVRELETILGESLQKYFQ